MYRRAAFLLSLGFALCVFSTPAQDAGKDETIKVETRLVSIPTVVSDRSGRYIPNLTGADFTVFQDGVAQKIEFFAATEEPINVALLIDTSHSTHGVLGDIKDSAKSFIKLLSPADKAMIVSFDYDVHILSQLTSDQEQLKKAIKNAEIPEDIGTMMRDAVIQTVSGAFKDLPGRKAIILLTDGKDAGSAISGSSLLYRMQETDTLVYTVMFTTENENFRDRPRFGRGRGGGVFGRGMPPIIWPDGRAERRRERQKEKNLEAQEFLQKLSEVSAGRFYSSKNGKLKDTFATIVEELRFQYRLGFYPPEDTRDDKQHELKVKVARTDVAVRTRSSYRVQK
jgi:VWFA-related protein